MEKNDVCLAPLAIAPSATSAEQVASKRVTKAAAIVAPVLLTLPFFVLWNTGPTTDIRVGMVLTFGAIALSMGFGLVFLLMPVVPMSPSTEEAGMHVLSCLGLASLALSIVFRVVASFPLPVLVLPLGAVLLILSGVGVFLFIRFAREKADTELPVLRSDAC